MGGGEVCVVVCGSMWRGVFVYVWCVCVCVCVCVCDTHVVVLKVNWKRSLVIFAPLCPEKTNMESRATAEAKLQQVGGMSPFWCT